MAACLAPASLHASAARLPQVSQHASLDLAFLSFRLDFNLFYEAELKPAADELPDTALSPTA